MVVLTRFWLLWLCCAPLQAAWYNGTGTAPVINDNQALARQQAARAALRDALLQAGASVSLMGEVADGTLTDSLFQVRAQGHINQVQKLEEHIKDDRVTVTLRADIWNDGALCDSHLTSKSLVLVPFSLKEPQQSAWGALEALPQVLSQRLLAELTQASADFLPKTLLPAPLALDPDQLALADRQALQALALQYQAQYLVLGRISNLALGRVEGGLLSKDQLVRQFAMELYLIDGISGLPILSRPYQSRTYWPFALNARVGAGSDQLWQSAYGLEIQRLLRQGVEDMSEALKCVRPKARVVRVGHDSLDVAMGARQGVRIGDVFRLLHQYHLGGDQGYSSLDEEQRELEVVQVFPDHSQLAPQNGDMPMNIQIRDLVQLDSFWE
ncbi:flagellar assembly protein T N-terminal domain-containing protein [Gallaecimonas xiamenensis]|uniref:Lipoprotein n=1 Tax=Gallaecimonas xiamenensis 3-C-1 TaxID=745411 RepID=K2J6A4_9GAMM|nr:flagellar assembly protein T N-terminal domain-containing protein [Gallaecimonas xiamenensis]EKE70578.1 hypothetical protein B3C1_13608 [Gallaecimonas xiamenensis 3-C-1]